MIIPITTSFIFGGLIYSLIYIICLLVVPWDVIFGKLVFDDWFGDTPSISIPFVGWLSFPLWLVVITRLTIAVMFYSILMGIWPT